MHEDTEYRGRMDVPMEDLAEAVDAPEDIGDHEIVDMATARIRELEAEVERLRGYRDFIHALIYEDDNE